MQKNHPFYFFRREKKKNNQIMIVNHLTKNSLIAIIDTKINM